MSSPTFRDYVAYFFLGYKLEGMNQTLLAVLRGLQYVIVSALAIIVFNIYDAIVKGTFAFTWEAWQQYLLPAVIFIVGTLNELLRKYLNPSVSLKTVQVADINTPRSIPQPGERVLPEQPPEH